MVAGERGAGERFEVGIDGSGRADACVELEELLRRGSVGRFEPRRAGVDELCSRLASIATGSSASLDALIAILLGVLDETFSLRVNRPTHWASGGCELPVPVRVLPLGRHHLLVPDVFELDWTRGAPRGMAALSAGMDYSLLDVCLPPVWGKVAGRLGVARPDARELLERSVEATAGWLGLPPLGVSVAEDEFEAEVRDRSTGRILAVKEAGSRRAEITTGFLQVLLARLGREA